jgi:hypothetical protein
MTGLTFPFIQNSSTLLTSFHLFFIVCGTGVQTKSLTLAKQAHYRFKPHLQGHFALVILAMASLKLFVKASLKPRLFQSQPPK